MDGCMDGWIEWMDVSMNGRLDRCIWIEPQENGQYLSMNGTNFRGEFLQPQG